MWNESRNMPASRLEVGNIIHGAVTTDRQLDKFVLQYKNGEIEEVTAKNNTFITDWFY